MVMREEVPYIRVIKSIPRDIRDKLPQEYLALIETTVGASSLVPKSRSDDPAAIVESRASAQGGFRAVTSI
jgi:hypothetical protein